ncbi:enoyl-CoA hydratase/isomerase family protein [Cupriavidus sp. 8B]
MSAYSLSIDADRIATVVFDMTGKVNVMNEEFMAAMEELMVRLESQAHTLRGVIVTSGKPTFFAGGDLSLMLRAEAGQEAFLTDHFDTLKSYFRRLEKLPCPVVAAINGTALGGGYELCLACHHRIVLRNARTQIGLPEVEFGILPAAGGVIRLSYLLGLSGALPYLLGGKKVDVQTAWEQGLVDEIAQTPEEMIEKSRSWILGATPQIQPWDAKPRVLYYEKSEQAESLAVQLVEREYAEAAKNNQAITEILDIARLASSVDVDEALAEETIAFVRLVISDNAKQRISQFFLANRAKERHLIKV